MRKASQVIAKGGTDSGDSGKRHASDLVTPDAVVTLYDGRKEDESTIGWGNAVDILEAQTGIFTLFQVPYLIGKGLDYLSATGSGGYEVGSDYGGQQNGGYPESDSPYQVPKDVVKKLKNYNKALSEEYKTLVDKYENVTGEEYNPKNKNIFSLN